MVYPRVWETPLLEQFEDADNLELARFCNQSFAYGETLFILTPSDSRMRRNRALTWERFFIMGYPGVIVRCPNGFAIRDITNFPQENFELYILRTFASRHAQGSISNFDSPIHVFPDGRMRRFSAICETPSLSKKPKYTVSKASKRVRERRILTLPDHILSFTEIWNFRFILLA